MPEVTEEIPPVDQEEEDDGGGAVKSFLDHLEDLRWVLIKSGVAVFIFMVICLAAGDRLMKIITWPLDRIQSIKQGKGQFLTIMLGDKRLGTTKLDTNQFVWASLDTNQEHLVFQLAPILEGNRLSLGLQRQTNNLPEIAPRQKLLNLTPAGGFITAFQLAVYGGIVLASPFIIFFVAEFILPALKRKEKKYLFRGFGIGTVLFFTGVSFCYFVLMPLALNASRLYSNWLGIEADQWTAEAFISFECKFMLGMGLGFELPVVLLILVKLGILDYQKLAGFRRYMIVVNLVLGAVLTTPEVLTQVMMAIPLQILYEVSVWIAWYWERQDKKRQAALDRSEVPAPPGMTD